MSEIKKGELVMVVRPSICCGHPNALGWVATVTGFSNFGNCIHCGYRDHFSMVALDNKWHIQPSRLRRLDPDALKDDVPTNEELHA